MSVAGATRSSFVTGLAEFKKLVDEMAKAADENSAQAPAPEAGI